MNGRKRPSTSKTTSEAPPGYDPHKLMNKINNNFVVAAPAFRLMTSRPSSSKSTLPSYMQVKLIYKLFRLCMIGNHVKI